MKTTHELLENQIERLCRILADRYDVRVVFVGNECKTDGRTIYLPALPDELTGPEAERLLTLMEGHIDHEVGHILFSDFGTLHKVKDGATRLFLGIIEDVREEAFMGRLWRGCKTNMDVSNRMIITEDIYPKWDEVDPLFKLCEAIHVLASDDDEIRDQYPQPELLDELRPLVPAIRKIKDLPSSDHSLAMAKNMMDALGFDFTAPLSELPGFPSALEELLKDLLEGEMSTAPASGTGPTHELSYDPSGGSSESEDSAPDGSGGGGDSEKEASPPDCSKALDEFGVDPGAAAKSAKAVEEMRSKAPAIEREAGGLRQHYKTTGDEFYAPYTTAKDVVKVMKAKKGDREAYVKTLGEVRQTVGVLTRKLRMAMASKRKIQVQRGMTWGALSPSRLPRFLTMDDPRVFERKGFKEALNIYISLLVDLSGSMSGSKMGEARKAVIAFGEFCDKVGIPFEVLGFTTQGFSRGEYNNVSPAEQESFTRWDKLKVEIYKEFHEQWRKVAPRTMSMKSQSHNIDGESVLIAAKRLQRAAPRDARRVMFVFSDGYPEYAVYKYQPNAQAHLKRVVRRCMASGIEMVGVGIKSESVSEYYPDYIVVEDAADLAATELQKLKEYLIEGRRQKRAG